MGERLGTAGQRESGRGGGGGGGGTAPTARPPRAEGEGVGAIGLAPTGRPRLSGTEGARARAGLSGLVWAKLSFSWNFYCLFY
jgi:hypothetical protein